MSLKPEQCVLDANGHYVNPLTHAMWHAFKAGLSFTPERGTFVVAELDRGAPLFNPAPRVYPFKDLARKAMRDTAFRLDRKCAVFQQITTFTAHSNAPNAPSKAAPHVPLTLVSYRKT
jgi:hypothetical protein